MPWDENVDPFTNTVNVTVARLRRKLGQPEVIHTTPGVGYSITPRRRLQHHATRLGLASHGRGAANQSAGLIRRRAGAVTRTITRVGRVGGLSDRNPRSGP
ncbi:MAG TPA: winged helix-turn-helix domain-containing protein [Solirubrobacteraceae bacterium]|nr:winged helix-turn-helix domain-containing protein [Solirubrobacteraceae bacterium]